jgi:hypothetical protein
MQQHGNPFFCVPGLFHAGKLAIDYNITGYKANIATKQAFSDTKMPKKSTFSLARAPKLQRNGIHFCWGKANFSKRNHTALIFYISCSGEDGTFNK